MNYPFTPWRPGALFGMEVIESPDSPRYVLPEEVLPGVPWPAGFREEINRWSRSFLGTTNLVPRGTFYVIGGHHLLMRHEDVVKVRALHASLDAQEAWRGGPMP